VALDMALDYVPAKVPLVGDIFSVILQMSTFGVLTFCLSRFCLSLRSVNIS